MGDLAWERVADEILGLLIGRFQHGSGHGFCGAGTRIFQEVWVADLAWVLRNIRWLDRNHGIQTRDSNRPLHFAYRQVFCPGAAGARWTAALAVLCERPRWDHDRAGCAPACPTVFLRRSEPGQPGAGKRATLAAPRLR